MKTAIYIEDGTVQLVITPETDFEKNSIKSFSEKPMIAKIFAGSFYDCRGGWVRQTGYFNNRMFSESDSNNDQSLILRMTREEAPNVELTGAARHEKEQE